MKYTLLIWTVTLILAGCSQEITSQPETNGGHANKSETERLEQEWELSKMFEVEIEDSFGKPVEKTFIGKENNLAVYPIFGEPYFVAGEDKRYFWIFWGEPEELQGKRLTVEAVKKYTGAKKTVLNKLTLGQEYYVGDASLPCLMNLPSPGIWKLNVYLDDEFFGDIVVEVSE